jgi:hypothetical protein
MKGNENDSARAQWKALAYFCVEPFGSIVGGLIMLQMSKFVKI